MNKKILVQISLLLIIFLLIISFYVIFFKNDNLSNKEDSPKIKNTEISKDSLINDLRYFSKDEIGNSYLLKAKKGYPDEKNSKIIYLSDVNAIITFDNDNEIIVNSDKAVYNNSSYDTEFIGNVEIFYENHRLTTKTMSALISQNLAILSGDIVYKNNLTDLYADRIEYDLIKRTSKISMFNENEKIKITHSNNGIN